MVDFSFSKKEIQEIIISALVLAFIFSKVLGLAFLNSLLIIAFVFLTHELIGHKLTANYYGCHAEYKMWKTGLFVALIFSFMGFIFAAPGAVYISPRIKKTFAWTIHNLTIREYGIISLGGPAVNIIFGFIFALSIPYFPEFIFFLQPAVLISFFLALFNLIPFGPLDGAKIFNWNLPVWAVTVGAALFGYMFLI